MRRTCTYKWAHAAITWLLPNLFYITGTMHSQTPELPRFLWMGNTLLYVGATFPLPICPRVAPGWSLYFGYCAWCCNDHVWWMFHWHIAFLVCKHNQLMDRWIMRYFYVWFFWGAGILFSRTAELIHIGINSVWSSFFSKSLPALSFAFCIMAVFTSEVIALCFHNSLMISDEHFFPLMMLAICMSSFEKSLFRSLSHLEKVLSFAMAFEFFIFRILILFQMNSSKYFSPKSCLSAEFFSFFGHTTV